MPDPNASPILRALHPLAVEVVHRLAEQFSAAGHELYLVGGVVRDILLGRQAQGAVTDLDFATSALPDETQRLGVAAGAASVYLVGERFGTVGLVFTAEHLAELDKGRSPSPDTKGEKPAPSRIEASEQVLAEITTYRTEEYLDETRHPTVHFGGTLLDDLARRDFTVNAIAVDAGTGEIVDPFGGQADLAMGVLRAVGEPEERFEEDPLRLLRAARFVAQLGFRIDPETRAAMIRAAPSLARISRERILAELTKLLTGEYVASGLETLRETGLLAYTLPELIPLAEATTDEYGFGRGRGGTAREKDLWAHTLQVVSRTPPRPVVRWAALLHDAAKPLCRSVDASGEVHFFGHEREGAKLAERLLRRLGADKATTTAVARLVELHARPESYEPDWSDSAVRRLALEAGDLLDDLLDLAAADVTSARKERQQLAAARIAALRARIAKLEEEQALAQLQSPLDGNELMQIFNRPPGRWIAQIKDQLREMVIEGELAPDDKETAEKIARQLMEQLEGSAS